MKKILLYIGIAIAAIGCTKDETISTTPASGEISFSAGVTTRVGSGDDDCTWASDDAIGIFTSDNEENLLYSVASDGAMTNESTTTLKPFDDNAARTYYAYHPYSEVQSTTISLNRTTDQSKPLLWAKETTNATNVTLQFNHVLAKVTFNLTAGGVDVTSLDDAKATLTGANATADFEIERGTFSYESTADITLTIDNNDTITAYLIPSSGAKLWIKVDGKTFVKSLDDWESGKAYEYDITVGAVPPPPVDYSSIETVNELLGRSDSDLRLSNCYMADPAENSTYIIPVGSRINTYWGDTDYGNDNTLQIGSDWTTNSTYTIEPLWNDFELTSYTDKITFTKVVGTDDDYAMQIDFADGFSYAGNMVVAVKKGETIVWSWHIWITDYNPYTNTNGTTYDISGYGTWMDRNIGARSTANLASKGNLYYQWGRKDPITPAATATSAVSTIADAVKAPEYFYNGTTSTDCDWCGSSTDWDQCRAYHWRDAKLASTQAVSGDKYGTTKSIYDPSPLGFMVPASLSTTEWSSPFAFIGSSTYNSDYSFSSNSVVGTNGITLPASGYLRNSNGGLNDFGSNGYYWSASSYSNSSSFYLYFYSSIVPAGNNLRASGYPVRPIQE